jgi:hypothetical protein
MNDREALERLNVRSELVFEGAIRLPKPIPDGFVLYYDTTRYGDASLIASEVFEERVRAGTWYRGWHFNERNRIS